MKKFIFIISFGLTIHATEGLCQKGPARFFGDPLFTDSASTLFIPTRYSEEMLSANKIALGSDYYANIVVYNFTTDSYKKLFDNDTFIESLITPSYYSARLNTRIRNITSKWIFLLVKNKDTNNNGRIDERDPSLLFAVSLDGQTLKQLTDETENVVSFDTFRKQEFILLKIQRDSDNDKSFKLEDRDFYFKKVSTSDLSGGKGIEIK
jgi:hypothetical protein